MSLPQPVIDYLNESAQREGLAQPEPSDDLFTQGILDSFALVDFIAVLEAQTGIKIPDSDVSPGNFQTLETIERYVQTRKGGAT
jgi:acyl carrier protein